MDEILIFIRRHTRIGAKIGEIKREDVYQYPPLALREAVINALVHANYALRGTASQIAIFSNRIEITSPGGLGLTYGQTLDSALAGVSMIRNRMMGRIFRELKLIERLGTGLQRILDAYQPLVAKQPEFIDFDTHFRVTLYSANTQTAAFLPWQEELLKVLATQKALGTADIAKIWKVTTRTARNRLVKMLELGLIDRVRTSAKDPYGVYRLSSK